MSTGMVSSLARLEVVSSSKVASLAIMLSTTCLSPLCCQAQISLTSLSTLSTSLSKWTVYLPSSLS